MGLGSPQVRPFSSLTVYPITSYVVFGFSVVLDVPHSRAIRHGHGESEQTSSKWTIVTTCWSSCDDRRSIWHGTLRVSDQSGGYIFMMRNDKD